MAFLPPAPVPPRSKPSLPARPSLFCHPAPFVPNPRRRFAHPSFQRASLPPPSPSSSPSSSPTTAPIPASLSDAAQQAIQASLAVLDAGTSRIFIEVDLTSGDATYTMLKNTLPLLRLLAPLFSSATTLHILFPDAGSAALARRDWPDAPPHISQKGIEEADIKPDDAGVIIVVPRASEVTLLPKVVEAAQALPLVVVNPDLVDMGVTGLSLNARQLRKNLIDTFECAYYLKTFSWGVLLRAYPGDWGVWVDDPDNDVGFRLVAQQPTRPSLEDVERLLSDKGQAEDVGLFAKIARFLAVYMKG